MTTPDREEMIAIYFRIFITEPATGSSNVNRFLKKLFTTLLTAVARYRRTDIWRVRPQTENSQ